jgi:hypothetical protein
MRDTDGDGVGSIADAGLTTTATPCQAPCQFMYRSLVEYNYKDGSYEVVPAFAIASICAMMSCCTTTPS